MPKNGWLGGFSVSNGSLQTPGMNGGSGWRGPHPMSGAHSLCPSFCAAVHCLPCSAFLPALFRGFQHDRGFTCLPFGAIPAGSCSPCRGDGQLLSKETWQQRWCVCAAATQRGGKLMEYVEGAKPPTAAAAPLSTTS